MRRDCDCPAGENTKAEKLLGYTASQRQRIKALQTLGLSEEDFDTCRAILLSSLGPSAFWSGGNDELTGTTGKGEGEEAWPLAAQHKSRYRGEALHHALVNLCPFLHDV